MNERPLEWMADCGESGVHKIGRIASLAATVVLVLWLILTFQMFAMLGALIFGGIFFLLHIRSYVEYEYSYFSDDLDVSVIYNKARRKKKFSCSLDEVEYMVKGVEQKEHTRYFCKKDNISSIYTLVVNQNGKRTAAVIEPSPEFIKIIEMKRKLR